ncbi:hypothetical protein ACFVSN_18630 [Kitasatospora sp. NPDC057904]|uniref:hypothetical protein n=1 Tax=Kitasatospora sp. NPDC057904 TaxID=3346275 RepID=UPI0036D7A6D0
MKQHTVQIAAAIIAAMGAIAVAFISGAFSHPSSASQSPGSPVGVSVPTPTPTPEPASSRPPSSPAPATAPASATPGAEAGEGGADSWIAQLYSEPVSTGIATRDQRLAQVRTDVPTAQVLRSDDFASLRPGYWVVYDPGPFSDGSAALAFCATHGRVGQDRCIGRFLSHHAADLPYQCFPPAANPSGYCRHG